MKTIVFGEGITRLKPCVATIGFFDGVHLGHRHLIEAVRKEAEQQGLESTVVTFDRHPRQVVSTDFHPCLLSTQEEKLLLLDKTGINNCVVLPFDKEMASLSAREFMQTILADSLLTKVLFTGYDHRFGHNRSEGFADYERYGREMGMEVRRGDPFVLEGVSVSSSVVRSLLSEGEVGLASRCLGYHYTLRGHVVDGEHIGTTIGFPTANLEVDDANKLLPADGVYAVKVSIPCVSYIGPAMLNIGTRPTFNGKRRTIEAHIFNFSENIYGRSIDVAFLAKIRGERKFNSASALAEQLKKDKEEVLKTINTSI